MGERLYSTVLLTISLLGCCLFGARTVLGNPLPEEDLQNDQEKPNSTSRVLKKHESFQVAEGESVTMPCNIEFGDSRGAVLWYNGTLPKLDDVAMFIDNEVVSTAPNKDFIEQHFKAHENGSVTIFKVTPETVGEYTCFINPDILTTHTVGIKVSVEIGHVQKTVEVGKNIVLSCKVGGYPKPKVEWRRKKSSDQTSTWALIDTSADATIPNADVSDSGVYMCSASNTMSEASKSIQINVIKEGLTAEQDLVYVDPLKKNATICCLYSRMNKDNAIPIRFYHEKTEIYDRSRFEVQPHGKSKICLNIRLVKDEDLGVYECKTDKGRGVIAKASITLTGAPERPILDVVTIDAARSPVLKWKVKALSPIMDYEILVRKQGEDNWVPYSKDTILGNDINPETIEQKFDKLTSGKYQTKLIVRNKHGDAEYLSDDMPLIVDKPGSQLEPGSGTGGASKNYAGVCVLVTILMTLLHR